MSDPSTHFARSPLASFNLQNATRLVFGLDAINQIGQLAVDLEMEKILVVTDQGILTAGHAARVVDLLEDKDLEVSVFNKVKENPDTRCVEDCLAMASIANIDGIIGLGGGSSMDTAKGCNFLLTNGGKMQDFWGTGKATKPMLPLIAVPTTAGTGSECQSYALIADEKTHQKMACGDPKAAAKVAILDPILTLSQPRKVTACTGIDAIAHAVETAVTNKRNPLSLMYSHEAFKLTVTSFPTVLEYPQHVEARGKMLLGAAFAGMAIESSMLGAAHAAANPLTAHFGIIHGQAVGMMLPHVVRFNGQDPETCLAYAELASAPELATVLGGSSAALDALVNCLEALINLADMPRSLADCGVSRNKIEIMAEEAAAQWTGGFNPRPVSKAVFIELYTRAFEPRGEGRLPRRL